MHERARAWFGVCATFLALSLPSAAGAQVLGTVAGNVKDASGAVLPGVTVEVVQPGADREGPDGRHRRQRASTGSSTCRRASTR